VTRYVDAVTGVARIHVLAAGAEIALEVSPAAARVAFGAVRCLYMLAVTRRDGEVKEG